MSFEEMDYVDIDYDSNTFSILKDGKLYTYDLTEEIDLLESVLDSGNVEYEIYGQEREVR
jgi:hypothetical protein